MRTDKKIKLKRLRRWRIRKKVSGTAERPRMSVCFTGRNIHVQFIDDTKGVTLSAASTLSKGTPNRETLAANLESAKTLGTLAACQAIEPAIQSSLATTAASPQRSAGKMSASPHSIPQHALIFAALPALG